MSLHRACCCGESGRIPGCAAVATCDACGDLEWRVRGTLIRDTIGGGGALVQRQTWVFSTLDIVTRNIAVSGNCRWLNNNPTSGSNVDFLSYSGTYVLQSGGTVRSATNFSFVEPANNPAWEVDSTCSDVTDIETLTVDLIGNVGAAAYQVADDQDGTLLNVSPPVMQFARDAFQDCPIGTFNAVDPTAGSFEYPSLPFIECVPA